MYLYIEYDTRKYGKAIVVLNGYDQRYDWYSGKTGTTVTFDENNRDIWWGHDCHNEERWISRKLQKQTKIYQHACYISAEKNCHTFHAPDGADFLITNAESGAVLPTQQAL